MLSFRAKIHRSFGFNYLYMFLFLLFGHCVFKPQKPKSNDFSQKEIDFYDFKLYPVIESAEEKRRKLLNKFRIKFYIWILIILGIAVYTVPIYGLLFGFITYPYVFYGLKHYKNEMRMEIIPKVLEYFGDELKYDYEAKAINLDQVYEYGVMPDCNKLKVEDHVSGMESGRKYHLFELTMSNVTIERRKKRHEYPVFHGLCIMVEFPKSFKHRTIVLPRGEYLNSRALAKSKIKRVKLEDPRLERRFDIYGEDQVESRFIFTPTLMERLCGLSDALKAVDMKCSFYNNSLQIMLPTRYNHFRINTVFKPVDFIYEFRMILKEMRYIKEVVKYL